MNQITDAYAAAARLLRDAYDAGAVPPLRDYLDPLDAAGAYAVQQINTACWLNEGRRVAGYKVGLTSAGIQARLGVDTPDYGVLFADMQIPDGGSLSPSRTLQPMVEGEIAVILAHDLTVSEPTIDDIRAAALGAVAAIEVVDSRISDWNISFADTVSDNGSAAFFILGADVRPLADVGLSISAMTMKAGQTLVSAGSGAATLGDPLSSVAWLARMLRMRGDWLRAGDVVLTGALGTPFRLAPGDCIDVSVDGLGRCGFRFG